MFDPEEFDSALDDLEVRLERLHLLRERYLSGSEALPPNALREEIDHQIATLLIAQRGLGALARARLTTLLQRHGSYQQSWESLGSASSGALARSVRSYDSSPPSPLDRGAPSSRAPASRSSISGPGRSPATPPLGTPTVPPLSPDVERDREPRSPVRHDARRERPRARFGADPARTIRDFGVNDTARTRPDLRAAFENTDSSATTPYLRVPSADSESAGQAAPPAPTPVPAGRTQAELGLSHKVTLERAREIHARLRASNTRLPSVERLAKRLGETEAKLKALHGDRTVTFDVVLKDGKAVVKPIVH